MEKQQVQIEFSKKYTIKLINDLKALFISLLLILPLIIKGYLQGRISILYKIELILFVILFLCIVNLAVKIVKSKKSPYITITSSHIIINKSSCLKSRPIDINSVKSVKILNDKILIISSNNIENVIELSNIEDSSGNYVLTLLKRLNIKIT